MTLTPIAIAVDAYVGLFGNPPTHVRLRAERIAQLKARAFDLALQEALRIEREAAAEPVPDPAFREDLTREEIIEKMRDFARLTTPAHAGARATQGSSSSTPSGDSNEATE